MCACNVKPAPAEDPAQDSARRDTDVIHEECNLAAPGAERLDANGDARADITIVKANGRELCRAADLNFDGIVDTWTYLDERGAVRRREFDFDRDGKVDEIAVFRAGVVLSKQRATAVKGRLDTWEFYSNGVLARTERDSDGDARIDQWWEYTPAGCPMMHSDVNRDGRPDVGSTIDYCKDMGYVPPERQNYRQTQSPDFQRTEALPTETVQEIEPPAGAGDSKGKGP